MNDLSTILKFVVAFIFSLILAVFGFRVARAGIDMIRYGLDSIGKTDYSIENINVYDNDEYYVDYEEDEDWRHYEDDQPSEEEMREIDERVAYLEENTDFSYFDQNFIYFMTDVGSDYMDLFFDEEWFLRPDYSGYEGEAYDERMEFWVADSKEFDTIAYVFSYETLFLNFPDEGFYIYYDVDKDTLAGLLRTESQDEYYKENIKDIFERKWLGE